MTGLPVGSYLAIQVTGHVGVMTPDLLARAVTGYLQGSGQCDVAQNVVQPTRDIFSDLLQGNILSWDYIASVQLRTLYPFDDAAEGKSELVDLVRQAFADVTSNDPTGAFLQAVDGATDGHAPAPAVSSGILDTIGTDLSSVGTGISGFVSGVQSDIKLVLVGVLALVLVIVALIAFGPNVPKLVPAFV